MNPTEQERRIIDSAIKWKLITLFTIALFGGFVFAKKIGNNHKVSIVERKFNTPYVISKSKDATINYSIMISLGSVFLQYSKDCIKWETISTLSNNNAGSVTSSLSGYIPAGYCVRLLTNGNNSPMWKSGIEVLF